MNIGDAFSVSGCVTKDKFLLGRNLADCEQILGFHPRRLASGMTVVALQQLPELDQFELAAYSNVATHHFVKPTNLDLEKLKKQARATWAINGPERLVKVLPAIRHDNSMDPDIQYPPGKGAPQWKILTPMRGKVVAIVNVYPAGRYKL